MRCGAGRRADSPERRASAACHACARARSGLWYLVAVVGVAGRERGRAGGGGVGV